VFGANAENSERNFFRAIREKLATGAAPVPVVVDQETAVTFAPHLAAMACSLMATGLPPLLHLTSRGSDSWFGWARRWAQVLGADPGRIAPVATVELGSSVRRPVLSVLDSEVQAARLEMERFSAEDGLRGYARELEQAGTRY
jgi:dTDP-4-dehydrorhamnose reductase